MLTLLDLLQTRDIQLGKYKLHLATGPERSVLRAFFSGKFQQFQEEQYKLNFKCDHVIGLISLDNDRWLFAGVYKVLCVVKGTDTPYLYQTEPIPGLEDLIGRVILHFHRPSRQSYIWGDRYAYLLEVSEILPQKMTVLPFPQYNNVILPYADLCLIVKQQEAGWKAALSNVQGVYLIADQATGRLYVGSAYGVGGIWQRWMNYALTGHGGNIEIEQVLALHGLGYTSNFQYSILEIADLNATEEYLVERESYWKEALLTQIFGYNQN